jgi:hypothetical protein
VCRLHAAPPSCPTPHPSPDSRALVVSGCPACRLTPRCRPRRVSLQWARLHSLSTQPLDAASCYSVSAVVALGASTDQETTKHSTLSIAKHTSNVTLLLARARHQHQILLPSSVRALICFQSIKRSAKARYRHGPLWLSPLAASISKHTTTRMMLRRGGTKAWC